MKRPKLWQILAALTVLLVSWLMGEGKMQPTDVPTVRVGK